MVEYPSSQDFDIFWFKREERIEKGKLEHEYFVVRLNSKKCPIKTFPHKLESPLDPYKKLLEFKIK